MNFIIKDKVSNLLFQHSEKVILGFSFVAMGCLFWQGMQTETYSKTNPGKLAALATSAKDHINTAGNWTRIAAFRPADESADQRIKLADKHKLRASNYSVGRLANGTIKKKTLLISLTFRLSKKCLPHRFRTRIRMKRKQSDFPKVKTSQKKRQLLE